MYDIPSPEEIRAFMAKNNLSGADVAALTGVAPRAARRWLVAADKKDYHPMPWAAWALMLLLIGDKTKTEILKMINAWKEEKTGRKLYERGAGGRPVRGLENE
jgi:hypothetical protein